MPLILDQSALDGLDEVNKRAVDVTQVKNRFTPQYFSKELNGNGRSLAGRLNSNCTAASVSEITTTIDSITKKHVQKSADVEVHDIPLSIAYAGLESQAFAIAKDNDLKLPIPFADKAVCVLTPDDNTTDDKSVWLNIIPRAALIRKEKSIGDDGKAHTDFAMGINYSLNFIATTEHDYDADGDIVLKATHGAVDNATQPTSLSQYNTWDAPGSINDLHVTYFKDADVATIKDNCHEALKNFKPYEMISHQAEVMATDECVDYLCEYLHAILATVDNLDTVNHLTADIALQLSYLESFPLSLGAYSRLFKAIDTHHAKHKTIIDALISRNMQLTLNANLNTLHSIKDQLPTIDCDPNNPYPMPDYYSTQQKEAITSNQPLTIVASGAGTGKSTVILERIKYIEHCGIDPHAINVLSFTNAAADNITDKNPGVRSKTFASQIAEIYEKNFPTHRQSNLDTVINSIKIAYRDDIRNNHPVITQFVSLLKAANKVGDSSQASLTALNVFIGYHLNTCIDILNRIRQTSLELQLIICYQLIDSLVEPTVPPQVIIVDEVQDTSIFEFAYILKYATKHKAALYMVGDASQTLYEFRAANPKALNALEASGMFASFRLTTNYRSNQEILDFANIALQNIDANTWSNIQLQSNNLDPVTVDSFTSKVTVKNMQIANMNSLVGELTNTLSGPDVRGYIDDCLSRGEQIAFLANTRREASAMNDTLQTFYPDRKIMSLTSDRIYADTVFSNYIMTYWDEVTSVDPGSAAFVFSRQVIAHLKRLVPPASYKAITKKQDQITTRLTQWWSANNGTISANLQAYTIGRISAEQFYDELRDNILQYEVGINNAKQASIAQRNRQRKEQSLSDADFFTSTIHGVKGLEFDNVVLCHRPVDTYDEASKRLYYVALTRAKNTEFIIAPSKNTLSPLVINYHNMITALKKD